MCKFSIIIPVFNAGKYIKRCLDGINEQTYKDYEIIFINDGSSDDSVDIIEEFCNSNKIYNYVLHTQRNAGAGVARNNGIALSHGEYIVFLDSDDYWDNNFLEEVNNVIEANNSDLIFIDIIRETPSGKFVHFERLSNFSTYSKDELLRMQFTGKMPWGGVRKVVRSSIVKENNLCYAPIKVGEESYYSFRALEEAETVSFQTKAYYHYVSNEKSLTANDTYDNSLCVFDFLLQQLNNDKKLDSMMPTVRTMAYTTVAISLNVLARTQSLSTKEKRIIAKDIINKYSSYLIHNYDTLAMDNRVKLLVPIIDLRLISLVFFISKIKALFAHFG